MTPLPPPPRKVVKTHRQPVLLGLLWLVYVAALAATLVAFLALANELALRHLGHDATATVLSIHEHPNAFESFDRTAHYAYASPGRAVREDHSLIAWRQFSDLRMPLVLAGVPEMPDDVVFHPDRRPTMAVRAYAVGPLAYSRAANHAYGDMLLWLPLLFAAVGAFACLAMHLTLVTRPRRRRRLFTHGSAVPGTVTGRHVSTSRYGHSYFVQYAFTPAGGSAPITGSTPVPTEREHDAATPGLAVTVLHEPEDPRYSTVYEFGAYRCA